MQTRRKNKRDIIKNLLIIFLIIMLILTFFSNTIMNRSLPEVSTQYAGYKQISDKIRASATVMANQDFTIVGDEAREIAEVLIHNGERVERDQVIFKLVENESSELTSAEQALNQLLIQQQQMLLENADKTDYDYEISIIKEDIAELEAEVTRRNELKVKIDEKLEKQRKDEADKKAEEKAEREEDKKKKQEYEAKLDTLEAELEALEDGLDEPNSLVETIKEKMLRYESTYYTVDELTLKLEEDKKVFDDADAAYKSAEAEYNEKEAQVEALEDEIEALEEDNAEYDELIAEANKNKSEYEDKLSSTNSSNANLASLKAAMESARAELRAIEREYVYFTSMVEAEKYLNKLTSTPDATPEEIAEAQELYNSAKAEYDSISGGVTRTEAVYLSLIDSLETAEKNATSDYEDASSSKKSTSGYQSKIDSYNREIEGYEEKKSENSKSITKLNKQLTELKGELSKLESSMREAEAERDEAEAAVESGESKIEYAKLNVELKAAEASVKAQTKAIEDKREEIEELKEDYAEEDESEDEDEEEPDDGIDVNADTSVDALEDQIKQNKRQIETLERQKAEDEKNAVYNAEIKRLELEGINSQIALKRKEIESIREKLINTEVKSPVSGTVTSISFTAGEEYEAGATLATVAITEKGYTMEFSATNEQCQRIRIGDRVELQNYYYGAKPEITVSAFKNDPSNPGRGKIVVLKVDGEDITAGQTLNFVIGDRTQSYDKVVPNSALREDANGKFVLVVESKSTPLGNRYIARRVAVEVITSDATSSALSGELLGGEFIITTASSPVSDGMQVRLADKN